MNEVQILTSNEIVRHNFDKYKEDLKRFSEKTNNNFEIESVDTTSWFLFDHKVTGEEFNERIEKIGEHLIELNKSQIELTREFRVIYEAFESLDKDYISGILSSIKSAEIAFNNSVYAINKAVYAIEELQKAQKDIKSTVDVQKRIINGLSDFNKRLNKNKHLDDVDKIWEDTQKLSVILDNIKAKIVKLEKAKNETISKVGYLEKSIQNENIETKKLLEKITYSVEDIQKNIGSVIEDQKLLANNLKDLQNKIYKNSHLDDIDVMWENTQYMMNTINELSNKLNNLEQEKNSLLLKNEELINLIKNKKDESKKIQNLSIATAILFVIVVVNFVVNYLR